MPLLFRSYITVDERAHRRFFYSLVHSRLQQGDLSSSSSSSSNPPPPLILWFQGGPGCSPMGNGFWTEIGPFYLTSPPGGELGSSEVLVRNNHTWAQVCCQGGGGGNSKRQCWGYLRPSSAHDA